MGTVKSLKHIISIKLFRKMGASFLLIWTGSAISLAGSMIVGFALSVWVFQQTSSALDFSGMIVASAIPSAGILLGIIGLYGLVVLDLTTFCIGAILIFMAVPKNPAIREKTDSPMLAGTIKDFSRALSYFKVHPPMMLLLAFSTTQNCLLCLVSMLISPLVLANHSVLELGWYNLRFFGSHGKLKRDLHRFV